MTVRAPLALILAAAFTAAPALARQAPAADTTPAAPAAVIPATPTVVPAPAATPAAPAAARQLPSPDAPVRTAPALPQPAQPAVASSAGSLVQTIVGLTIVLGTLALFAWAMKRFGPRPASGAAGLRIVGALNLGGRERIMVVEVGDQWIVVGASPGRVNALATMPRQESSSPNGEMTMHPYAPSATSFSEWLKQTIEKRNAK